MRAFADEAKAAYVLNEFLVHAQIAKAEIDFEIEGETTEVDDELDDEKNIDIQEDEE